MALSDTKLKNLKPQDKAYKVADRDGMYVVVSPKGTITFAMTTAWQAGVNRLPWGSTMSSKPAQA